MPPDPKAQDVASSSTSRGTGVQLFVFLPATLYKALCERAEDEETTLAAVMRESLGRHLKRTSGSGGL